MIWITECIFQRMRSLASLMSQWPQSIQLTCVHCCDSSLKKMAAIVRSVRNVTNILQNIPVANTYIVRNAGYNKRKTFYNILYFLLHTALNFLIDHKVYFSLISGYIAQLFNGRSRGRRGKLFIVWFLPFIRFNRVSEIKVRC